VHDRPPRPGNALIGPFDQLRAALDEHLNGDDYPRLLSDFPLNECERLR
jgi:hypothetical protein